MHNHTLRISGSLFVLAALLLTACAAPPAANTDTSDQTATLPAAGAPGTPHSADTREADTSEVPEVYIPPTLEESVIREINYVRNDPQKYAVMLKKRLRYYKGKYLRLPKSKRSDKTREGASAMRDLIEQLAAMSPAPPLFRSPAIDRAARVHAEDIGPRGMTGHVGSDKSFADQRLARFAHWSGAVAEAISIGPDNGREIVLKLLVSDGDSQRVQRKRLLDPTFHHIGISCKPHQSSQIVCVIVYATDIRAR